MIAPGVHEAEVGSRFDAAAGRFKAAVVADDYRLAALLRGLAGLDAPRVLDLGCGKGRFARALGDRGARVVGLDLSRGMLSQAGGLDRVLGTSRRLPFAGGRLDAVVAVESLQHVADLDGTLAESSRVLRPGGRLIIIDRNAGALDARRPWLPGLAIKWVDERRGRWIYPAGGPVRERWFWPGRLARMLASRFEEVGVRFLVAPGEAGKAIFRAVPTARAMACWTATAPGGIW